MWHMKDIGQGYLFLKGSFFIWVPVKALEAGQKSPFFKYMSTIFLFGRTKFVERFFYHNPIPVRFYWILTYIWSISLCKITQLQESYMRPTGWTLSYQYTSKISEHLWIALILSILFIKLTFQNPFGQCIKLLSKITFDWRHPIIPIC